MNPTVYECELCEYVTPLLGNYKKHVITNKHLWNYNVKMKSEKALIKSVCYCGLEFKSRSGIWKHQKKCHPVQPMRPDQLVEAMYRAMAIEMNMYINSSGEYISTPQQSNCKASMFAEHEHNDLTLDEIDEMDETDETDKIDKIDESVNCIKLICNVNGCEAIAVSNTRKCRTHSAPRCIVNNCGSGAVNKTGKCVFHGGGERCVETGCTKSAQGKTNKCISHGGGLRCAESGCTSSARCKSGKCKSHGGGLRCIELGCTKSARCKTGKCTSHKRGERCNESGCVFGARGKTGKCKLHKVSSRCPNCISWIDSRAGSPKYDGHCATCFKRIFPEDSRSKVIHTHNKEIMVRNIINANYDGFIHDRPLYTGECECTHRRRIDHRKLIGNTILAIETDEFGHRGYDPKDEKIRYDDVYMIHSGKWLFIRFNPDDNVSKVDISDKLDKLIAVIEECIERIENDCNDELVEIIKLYC